MYVCCCLKKNQSTPRPYVVFTLKTVLTYIQYPSLSYSSRQRNEFTFHKQTQNKVQKKEKEKKRRKKRPRESPNTCGKNTIQVPKNNRFRKKQEAG